MRELQAMQIMASKRYQCKYFQNDITLKCEKENLQNNHHPCIIGEGGFLQKHTEPEKSGVHIQKFPNQYEFKATRTFRNAEFQTSGAISRAHWESDQYHKTYRVVSKYFSFDSEPKLKSEAVTSSWRGGAGSLLSFAAQASYFSSEN